MKQFITFFTSIALCFSQPLAAAEHESLKQEIRQSIARGNAWLLTKQNPDGSWDDGGLTAITALALTAAMRDPNRADEKELTPSIKSGYAWLMGQQKPDGGIYNRGLSVYNTAISMTALLAAQQPDYEAAIVRARKHLIDQQWDLGKAKESDDPNDGGIGYGSKNTHTDLSNTYFAIEALALSQHLIEDGRHGDQPELNWDAARQFLSRSQNLRATNDQPWASDDEANRGGFIYRPGESKAGEEKLPDGSVALRSYGSMSYAGLLSFIYAKMDASDPRVVAVKSWLTKNYNVKENPGLGDQGLYYYYQTMAKALTVANITTMELSDGREVDWRKELGAEILSRQREDGSWVNDNGRWMESNPVLVTAYNVLSLAQIYDSIPK